MYHCLLSSLMYCTLDITYIYALITQVCIYKGEKFQELYLCMRIYTFAKMQQNCYIKFEILIRSHNILHIATFICSMTLLILLLLSYRILVLP